MTGQDRGSHGLNKGRLFILSAPSGTGKSTLCRALITHFGDLHYSVSYTTRPPRKGESEGKDYRFIPLTEFERRIKAGRWAEWANVHGNYYGTSADDIEKHLDAGKDLLLDIDVQGAALIQARYPKSISIFILPPSMEELKSRIEKRGTDDPDTIRKRLAEADREIKQKDRYHHVVINDQLEPAIEALVAIIETYRQR